MKVVYKKLHTNKLMSSHNPSETIRGLSEVTERTIL